MCDDQFYNHFFYEVELKMYITVIFDCYVFENQQLNISYIDENNNHTFYDKTISLSIKESEYNLLDYEFGKIENRLMMCDNILMTKILESI